MSLSQNEQVLEHINKFGSITPREAYDDYQIMRLASRVNDLRKAGRAINTEMRSHQITGKRYAKYTLAEG